MLPVGQILDQHIGVNTDSLGDITADDLGILGGRCLDAKPYAYGFAQAIGIIEDERYMGDGLLAKDVVFIQLSQAVTA